MPIYDGVLTDIDENLNWLKRMLYEDQNRADNVLTVARNLVTSVESYLEAKKNAGRRKLDPKWEENMRKAAIAFRTSESDQFNTANEP